MRYSFIIPYLKRSRELWHTLLSYRHWYGKRNDIEIIIVEDGANIESDQYHQDLIDVLYAFGDLNWVHLMSEDKNQYNPVKHRNAAAKIAKGLILINTNPECWHRTNILKALDTYCVPSVVRHRSLPEGFGPAHPQWNVPSFKWKYDQAVKKLTLTDYIVCACEACHVEIDKPDHFDYLDRFSKHWQWYQHSQHNNRMLHWCSAISKDNYEKIKGFDENYASFIGYDDDDFRETVRAAGIPIVCRDDLIVVHTEHDRGHQGGDEKKHLDKAGMDYFNSKWEGRLGDYRARPHR